MKMCSEVALAMPCTVLIATSQNGYGKSGKVAQQDNQNDRRVGATSPEGKNKAFGALGLERCVKGDMTEV